MNNIDIIIIIISVIAAVILLMQIRGIIRIPAYIRKLISYLEINYKRKNRYALPDASVIRDAIDSMKIASFVAKIPYIRYVNGDYLIFELRIRLRPDSEERIDQLRSDLECDFTEICRAHCGVSPGVFVKGLDQKHVIVWFSLNQYGDELLLEEKMREDVLLAPSDEDPVMEDLKSDLPVMGYDLEAWNESSWILAVCVDVRKYPSGLICGPSGSGKSVFLTVFLSEILSKFKGEIASIYYLDYKYASESKYISDSGYKHYFSGEECAKGIEEFYAMFQNIRESGRDNDPDQKLNLLIFDEAAGFIMNEQMRGKEGKAAAEKHMLMLANIAQLGRSYRYGLFVVEQQPSSEFMKTSMRESLHSKICFLSGGFSPEMKRMIGVDNDTADLIHKHDSYEVGTSVVLRQGKSAVLNKVPVIADIEEYQRRVIQNLPTA